VDQYDGVRRTAGCRLRHLVRRERTLSIHTIVTTPREAFYWLAVLVTFALGTAAGDWTLELTGWTPGAAVLLPLGLLLAVFVSWKLGAGPVLSFWLAYILTRPLARTSATTSAHRTPTVDSAWAPSARACCSSARSCRWWST
jgi:uncharacterized membrane-anchored protein